MKFAKMLMLLAIAGLAFAGQIELSIQEESHDPLWAKPRILIENHSDAPTELHRLRVHYRVDPSEQAMAEIFSPFGYSVSLIQQADGSGYAEVDLRGKVLQPGDSWNWGNGIQLGIHNSSWAPWRSALVNYLVSLHDPFGGIVAGTEPSFSSSSSSASRAELEVLIKETSDDPQWSKPRIQIKNKANSGITISELIYEVTAEQTEPETQVFDPYTVQTVWEESDGRWLLHIKLNSHLSAGESFNWGNGVYFGVHNKSGLNWNASDDPGLLAIKDSMGNLIWGAQTISSSSSQQFPGSSSYISSSSSESGVSSSSELNISSSSLSSSSNVSGVTVAKWPFPQRTDTLPPAVLVPGQEYSDTTTFAQRYAFYTDPVTGVQKGVAAGVFSQGAAGFIVGRVLDEYGHPLIGAKISLPSQPHLGNVRSGADGVYRMLATPFQGQLVQIEKADYLVAQRRISLDSAMTVAVPEVALVKLSPVGYKVDLSEVHGVVAMAGERISDDDGERQSLLLLREGTQATVWKNGVARTLETGTFRATEYTVGEHGMQRMPAQLPENTAYTYAVELSLDEAILDGADEVRFSKPIVNYLENFLDFPVGVIVPSGSYNKKTGEWVAELDGVVVGIVGKQNGLALLDVDGDGVADNGTNKCSMLGIDNLELAQIGSRYAVGQTLWRVQVSHFSPWDYNFPYAPPSDMVPTPDPKRSPSSEDQETGKDNDPCVTGSVIDIYGCSVGEVYPIAGTDMQMIYSTRNSADYGRGREVYVDLSDSSGGRRPRSILVSVAVAGQVYEQILPASAQEFRWLWDGKDGFGRPVNGYHKAKVTISYVWDLVYQASSASFSTSWSLVSFGTKSSSNKVSLTANRGLGKIFQVSSSTQVLYVPGGRKQLEFGDWTVSGYYSTFGKLENITDTWGGRADLKPLTEYRDIKVYRLDYIDGWGKDNAVDIAGGSVWFYAKVDSSTSIRVC